MAKVKITINNQAIEAEDNLTILEVAKKNGVSIPHLCYNPRLKPIGACRMCVVDVKGMPKPAAACTTTLREGMVVNTHTPKILEARRINLELLLANHDLSCITCKRNQNCKLQKFSEEFMVKEMRFKGGEKRVEPVDNSSVSIQRNNNRCILCEKCVRICNEIQTVNAIGLQNRGFPAKVAPPFGQNMKESNCVNCGQCVIHCPTAALTEKSDIEGVIAALGSGKTIIAQTAPSIRAALGETFGMPVGTNVTGKMVTALKEIGFTKVFDTDLGADITIIEEATEFIKRFKENRDLPMITTCCPAWIKFGEQFYYDQLNHMSSCKSPQAILSSLIKTYFAQKLNIDPKEIILIDIMPCTAKKFEIVREEFAGDADFVLTTVELGKLLKLFNVDFPNLPDTDFDTPLGESTGAGVIFGRSGGVMEAALRTAADWLSGQELQKIEYEKIEGLETKKEATIWIEGKEINVCAVHTLGEARKLMEEIKAGTSKYHFIEIMACYGGCIGGGGQPGPINDDTLKLRAKALSNEDTKKVIRKSHKNPAALKLYEEYLGEFGSEKAHKLLHTHYHKRDSI